MHSPTSTAQWVQSRLDCRCHAPVLDHLPLHLSFLAADDPLPSASRPEHLFPTHLAPAREVLDPPQSRAMGGPGAGGVLGDVEGLGERGGARTRTWLGLGVGVEIGTGIGLGVWGGIWSRRSCREWEWECGGDAERDSKNSDSGLMTSTSTVTRVFRSFMRSLAPPWVDSKYSSSHHTDSTPTSSSSGDYLPPKFSKQLEEGVDLALSAASTRVPRPAPPGPPVPRDYLDLRFRGLGLVLDLGWRRSEEGLRWELDDWREATRRQHQARGKGGALWGSPHFSGEQDTSERADGAEGGKVSRAGKVGRWLGRIIGRGDARNGGDGVGTKTGTGTGSDGKRKGGERSGFWATTPFVGAW
jgi:hypothetical protein